MDDVQAKAVFPAQRQHQADRSQLRLVRARLQVGGVVGPICLGQGGGRPINRAREFRMNQQRKASPGNMRQSQSQLLARSPS